MPLADGRASALQFRYLFVTDRDGLKVIDVTEPTNRIPVANNVISIAMRIGSTWRERTRTWRPATKVS